MVRLVSTSGLRPNEATAGPAHPRLLGVGALHRGERLSAAGVNGRLAGLLLKALHGHVDVLRIEFEAAPASPCALGRKQVRVEPDGWIENDVAAPRSVQNGLGQKTDGFDRRFAALASRNDRACRR